MSDAVQTAIDCHYLDEGSRRAYLQSVIIKVKQIEKTIDFDQLIVLNTIRKDTNIVVSVLIRKLSELHSLIQHITNKYGGHIIPILNTDLYSQKDIQMPILTPIIEEFLNDLRTHPYIQQDQKLYEFVFFQNHEFKKVQYYQKMLEDASNMSKKYLNSIFTRKQFDSNISSLVQLSNTYQLLLSFEKNFKQIKSIAEIFFAQNEIFEDVFTNLSQMSCILAKSLPPSQSIKSKVRKRIFRLEKYFKQIHQAYSRVQILNQTVRQLKGNINKGLHDKSNKLETTQITLGKWSKSLNRQLLQFLQQGQKAFKFITSNIYQMKKMQIEFCCISSGNTLKQNKQKENSIQNESENINNKQQGSI